MKKRMVYYWSSFGVLFIIFIFSIIAILKYTPRKINILDLKGMEQNGYNNFMADGTIAYAEEKLFYIDDKFIIGGLRQVSEGRDTYICKSPEKVYAYKDKLFCFYHIQDNRYRIKCIDTKTGIESDILSDVRYFAVAHDKIYYVSDSTGELWRTDTSGKNSENLGLRSVHLAVSEDCVIAYAQISGSQGGEQYITVFREKSRVRKKLCGGYIGECIDLTNCRLAVNPDYMFDFNTDEEQIYLERIKETAPHVLEEYRFQNAVNGMLYTCNAQAKNILEPFSYKLVPTIKQNEGTVGIWKRDIEKGEYKRISTISLLEFSVFDTKSIYYTRYGYLYRMEI